MLDIAPTLAERSARPTFLGWDAPALPRAAALLADAHHIDDVLRLDGVVVVLPGARAGRRLKELLVEEASRREARLLPPRIVTVGNLPELLYRAERPLADGALARRVWAAAAQEVAVSVPRELAAVFPALPAAADLRGWQRLAAEVERLHREVAAGGHDFRRVAALCREGLLFDDCARWLALARVQDAFRARLAALGRIDRESARLSALEGGTVAAPGPLYLLGVAEMPAVARRFLTAPGVEARPLVHAPPELADRFDELGCVRPDAWAGVEVVIDDAALRVVNGPGEQADEALRFLASLDPAHAPDEITVGVATEEVVPYLEQRLGGAGLPVRYAAGTLLTRSRPYRLLEAAADFLDGRRFQSLAALVRHPDVGDWLSRARPAGGGLGPADGWLDRLDRFHAERLPAQLPDSADGIEAARVGRLREALDERMFAALRGRKPLSAWMPALLELLVAVYGGERLRRDEAGDRLLIDAAAQIRDAAAALASLPAGDPRLDPECGAAAALRLLLDEAAGGAIPPEAERAAIELLGWLELHLDDAPAAVLTGFNEPALPEAVNADAFLPNALRTRLGIEDNARRYARDAYQLTALLRSRRSIRLVAARRTAAGDPLRPSRLMFAVSGEPLARRVRRFYVGEEAEPPHHAAPATVPGEQSGARRSRFLVPPEPTIVAAEVITELSVTAFRQLLADPYLFALERVLRLRGIDDGAHELDGAAFGSLAHAVLAEFARSEEAAATDEREVFLRLEAILRHQVEARYGAGALPAARLQFEQLRLRLRAFAEWQARRARDGWLIRWHEAEPAAGAPFPVDGAPFTLRGRIDRVDHHAARGAWEVLDYKTGDGGEEPEKTHRRGRPGSRTWIDLQLPLYRHLLRRIGEAQGVELTGEPVRLGYVLLPAAISATGCVYADWSDGELDGADEAAREAIRTLRENVFTFTELRAGGFLDERLAMLLGRGVLAPADDADLELDAL